MRKLNKQKFKKSWSRTEVIVLPLHRSSQVRRWLITCAVFVYWSSLSSAVMTRISEPYLIALVFFPFRRRFPFSVNSQDFHWLQSDCRCKNTITNIESDEEFRLDPCFISFLYQNFWAAIYATCQWCTR